MSDLKMEVKPKYTFDGDENDASDPAFWRKMSEKLKNMRLEELVEYLQKMFR